jgi:hypothetical protein
MSKHLAVIQKHLQGTSIHATGEAMGYAIALTDDELLVGKAKLFGATVQRFTLAGLSDLRAVPNPSANLLQIEFAGPPPQSLMVMYGPDARADFGKIIELLQQRLRARIGAGS